MIVKLGSVSLKQATIYALIEGLHGFLIFMNYVRFSMDILGSSYSILFYRRGPAESCNEQKLDLTRNNATFPLFPPTARKQIFTSIFPSEILQNI